MPNGCVRVIHIRHYHAAPNSHWQKRKLLPRPICAIPARPVTVTFNSICDYVHETRAKTSENPGGYPFRRSTKPMRWAACMAANFTGVPGSGRHRNLPMPEADARSLASGGRVEREELHQGKLIHATKIDPLDMIDHKLSERSGRDGVRRSTARNSKKRDFNTAKIDANFYVTF